MISRVLYTGEDTAYRPTKALWKDCPLFGGGSDPWLGIGHFDDFLQGPKTVAGVGGMSGYAAYGNTGVTFAGQGAVAGGVLEVSANDADNDEAVLTDPSPGFVISDTSGAAKKLWFEALVKKASITADHLAMFVGLAADFGNAVCVAKADCLAANTGALGAFSFIGFHVDHAGPTAFDFVYKADGQTAQVLIAAAHTLVADTWVKVGFVYDPNEATAKRIVPWVAGAPLTTYVTATQIATATFPDAEPMGRTWATRVGEAVEHKAQLGWWGAYQLF